MKPEPLQGKKNGFYPNYDFDADDVKSAVEWLKAKIRKDCWGNEQMYIAWVDEAFEDVK